MNNKLRAFLVKHDVNNYQYFLWDLASNEKTADVYDALTCWGAPLADRWKPAPVFIYQPKLRRGDFPAIGMASGGLGIAPWALQHIGMFAEMAGELLPVPYKEQTFSLLNITQCIECLDAERSEWQEMKSTGRKRLRKPFLRADRMCASTLFKSAHSPLEIYCIEYSGDPEEEFKASVEHHKLKGLVFEEVMMG